jgi:hypothetical protein
MGFKGRFEQFEKKFDEVQEKSGCLSIMKSSEAKHPCLRAADKVEQCTDGSSQRRALFFWCRWYTTT